MQTSELVCRNVGEWAFQSAVSYLNPFIDVTLDAVFTGPDGRTWQIPGFYDGNQTWRVRFNPNQPGTWRYRLISRPADEDVYFGVIVRHGQ